MSAVDLRDHSGTGGDLRSELLQQLSHTEHHTPWKDRPVTSHRLITPALVVAALLLTFGGSATAAKLITSKQVKDGSVTAADLRDTTVTGADIPSTMLLLNDLDPATKIPAPPGPPGEVGPIGRVGPRGVPGVHFRYPLKGAPTSIPPGASITRSADCGGTLRVLNGGVRVGEGGVASVQESAPKNNGYGWTVRLRNDGTEPLDALVWAMCFLKQS